MSKPDFLIISAVLALFISLFLALFLFTVNAKTKISNRLLAVFLILIGIDIGGVLLEFIVEKPTNLGMLKNSVTFLQMPVFYLYVLSVCYSDFKLKSKHVIHITPFILANLVLLPRYYLVDIYSKIDFLQNNQNLIELKFNYILLHIQIAFYMSAVFIILRKTKRLYQENYAGKNISSYHWLSQFAIALTIFYALVLLKNIFKYSEHPNISEWLKIGLFLFQLLIVCWYLLKALNNPSLFRNIDSSLKLVSDIVQEQNHIQSKKNEKSHKEVIYNLETYMENEKPFLNPSVTIQKISDDINIPVRDLSILINHKVGQHFFDFINAYRIEHAMMILKDSTKSNVTILEILYEVGFNSKSSFNTAFKKHTGNTPTEYRTLFL
jgi:AraC-like DNA-binding protein